MDDLDKENNLPREIDNIIQGNYSLDMIDTMFADSLSRGMQNAITSQQNAQMVSSSSITNACARILQTKAAPATATTGDSSSKPSDTSSKPDKEKFSFFHALGEFFARYRKSLLRLLLIVLLSIGAYEIITRLYLDSSVNLSFNGRTEQSTPSLNSSDSAPETANATTATTPSEPVASSNTNGTEAKESDSSASQNDTKETSK